MALRRVLDGDKMIADPADMAERAYRPGGVVQQGLPESRIRPSLGDDLRAIMRADLCFVGLDNGIERGRIDIAFFGQDGFQRSHAQFSLGKLRMVVIVVVVVIVVMFAHIGEDTQDYAYVEGHKLR
jgi:hypothetical protein